MKTIVRAAASAALLAVFTSAPSAFAVNTTQASSKGHYEWRTQPGYGPRGPTRPPIRVWVSDSKATAANCDCAMMQGTAAQAADCMKVPVAARPSRG